MDIGQDWPYICAAFQQAYGIDLYADKSLHILRFRALLQAIPKSTKLSEIIGIRAMKVPAPNRHNQEQIAEIDAQPVEAGDWALISLRPFISEESLTVTMKTGEAFTVRVTARHISSPPSRRPHR